MSANENSTEKEEKLNQDEFRELIPHLECNQLFLIEVKSGNKWKNLFEAHLNKIKKLFECTICSENLRLHYFENHITSSTHLSALDKVEKFYHPLYTTECKDTKDTEDLVERKMQKANAVAAKIAVFTKSIISSSLKHTSFTSEAALSMDELLTVEFQRNNHGRWQALLRKIPYNKFKCEICLKVCYGVIPLNDHLKGSSHQISLTKVYAIRVPKYEHLTKHCLFLYDPAKKSDASKSEKSKEAANIKTEKSKNNTEREKSHEKKDDVKKEESSSSSSKNNRSDGKTTPSLSLSKDTKNGLIGVEYIAQLKSDLQPESYLYACCLCDSEIMTSADLMEKHLKSYKHRLTYCETHYSDTIGNFKRMISDCRANYELVMPFVLEKIAFGIDQYHGYGTPHNTTEMKFKKARKQVTEELRGLPHACQEYGPSFSNVVTAQEIRDYKRNPIKNDADTVSKDTTVRFTIQNKKKPYLHMRHHFSRPITKKAEIAEKSKPSKTPNVRRERKRSRSRTRSPTDGYVERKRRTSSRHSESYKPSDIWIVYRDQISKAAIEFENLYVGYRKNPEKHPLYDQEWNAFWRRRKEELMLEGKNYRAYNFQPEWTSYFRQRLEQLFGEDLQNSKLDVRRRLNIPLNAEEDSFPTNQGLSENVWVKSYNPHHAEEQLKPEAPKVEKPTVIHMLRLMTALEEHLGNLGTKILELLTKALSLEKYYPADSPELEKQILNASNYKVLKIATEKLKSKLYADLIEGNKVNSFKRVIECSEIILKKAEMMGLANENELALDTENTKIKKLIEVLETKNVSSLVGKKSLSDALMEVISQKKLKETPPGFDPPMRQTEMPVVNIHQNYSRIPKESMPYFPPRNTRAGAVNNNTTSNVARGRGMNIPYHNQYGNNSFGNANLQWPNAHSMMNYPQNYDSNSGFMNPQPNGSNTGNWQ